jgi:WD40 repeat protein
MKRSLLLFVFTLIPAFFVSNAHGAKNDFSMVVQNSHGGTIKSFQFFRQDKYIVSIGSDKTIKIWTSDGRLVNTLVGHTARIECMAVNREGTLIVSGSTDGGDLTLRLWDVEGRMLKILDRGKAYNTVAFSPDGKKIIAGTTGSEGKQVLCFSITGEFLKKAELPSKIYSIDGLGFSPDGKKILAASGKDLWLLDAQTLAIVQSFPSLDSGITAMALSPDGTRIITASEDNVLRLLTLDGRLMHTFKGHTDRVWALAYAPDGKMIVSGSFDNTIRLWNSSGKQIRTINVDPLTVMCVRFTDDGKKIAASGMTGDAHIGVNDDSGIGFWDLQGTILKQ